MAKIPVSGLPLSLHEMHGGLQLKYKVYLQMQEIDQVNTTHGTRRHRRWLWLGWITLSQLYTLGQKEAGSVNKDLSNVSVPRGNIIKKSRDRRLQLFLSRSEGKDLGLDLEKNAQLYITDGIVLPMSNSLFDAKNQI